MDTSNLFLILTKEQITSNIQEKVFLGRWCVDYSANITEIKEAEKYVLPHFLNDHFVLTEAYHYLQETDRNFFPSLCKILDKSHQVEKSVRYWRILLGYWWIEFLESTYTRYIWLKGAAKLYPNAQVNILDSSQAITPYDTKDLAMLCNHDWFNYQIFSQIISFLNLFNKHIVSKKQCDSFLFNHTPSLKTSRIDVIKRIACLFSKSNNFYLASTFIDKISLCKIAWRLKEFPLLTSPPRFLFSKPSRNIDITKRQMLTQLKGNSEFEKLIAYLLPIHLPKIYLEDFNKLKKAVKRFYPQHKVNCIMTSAGFADDEGFKLFTANQTENYQTPYIISQHGGCYGIMDRHGCEAYEKDVADYYLTYGWNEQNSNKVIPFIANRFKKFNKKSIGKSKQNIILVLTTSIRYPRILYPGAGGPEYIDYLNDQITFLSALPIHIRKKLVLRPHGYQSGWHEVDYIKQHIYPFAISKIKKSLSEQAKQSSLVICTYNGTAHLETFILNCPTLLFWNPKSLPIRREAASIHQKLHELGILHYNPIKAANHLANIHEKILEWWGQTEIQEVRKEYCQKYAATSEKYTEHWLNIIKSLSCQ